MFVNLVVGAPSSSNGSDLITLQRPVYRAYSRLPVPGELVDLFDDEELSTWLPVMGVRWENGGPPDLLIQPPGEDEMVPVTAELLEEHGYRQV